MGLGTWIAFTPSGTGAMIMGDIILTETDLKPVQQEVIRQGLNITAIHNHFLRDRKSTRLNSSHLVISYAVFCLKKKTLLPTSHLRLLDAMLLVDAVSSQPPVVVVQPIAVPGCYRFGLVHVFVAMSSVFSLSSTA